MYLYTQQKDQAKSTTLFMLIVFRTKLKKYNFIYAYCVLHDDENEAIF